MAGKLTAEAQIRIPTWYALPILLLAGLMLVGCGTSTDSPTGGSDRYTLEQARSELRRLVEDVYGATASRYGVKDDLGNVLDTVKIIAAPESGGFAGVYHTYREDRGAFHVHLATSPDLMSWKWQVELAANASQPSIKAAADGGFVAAWEQEPDNHLKFAYYGSWSDLINGVPEKTFEAPRHFSTCAEGTPNLYSASRTLVDAGFHFFASCDLDRQARGTTNWESWYPVEQPALDRAVLAHGVMGNVGDRDAVHFAGFDFTLIEGQVVRGDWSTWKVFLYDEQSGKAEKLDIQTHAGSSAFTNPTIELVQIGGEAAILVTLFVPQEGAKGGEAGQLIYYRIYEPVVR